MRKFIIIFSVSAIIFSGCGRNNGNDDTRVPNFNIFSDGTSGKSTDEPVLYEYDAAFYIPPGMTTRYASANLSADEKEIYNLLLGRMGNFEKSLVMDETSDVYSKLLDIIRVEQLAFCQVGNRYVGDRNIDTQRFDLVFEYRFDNPKELGDMNLEAEKVADEIIANISGDMSGYDILKYFHDYLIINCTSDIEYEFADTVYGTLVNRKALCEGYTKTFSYLCNRAGIENMIATGYTTVPHMWNMVKLDGNWYHIDVTWDKPGDDFLEMYPGLISYQYFMVTDSVIENDHTIREEYYSPPKAYGTKENYFIKENRYVNSSDEFLPVAESALINAVKNKDEYVMLKFDSTDQFLSVSSKLNQADTYSEAKHLSEVVNNMSDEFGIDISLSYSESYESYRIMLFILKYG